NARTVFVTSLLFLISDQCPLSPPATPAGGRLRGIARPVPARPITGSRRPEARTSANSRTFFASGTPPDPGKGQRQRCRKGSRRRISATVWRKLLQGSAHA